MVTTHHARLTSAELCQLWLFYQDDSASLCVLSHFLETVEDPDIQPILECAYQLMENRIQKLADMFHNENIPQKVDFVKKQSFLTGWFGERRPLLSLEITNLYTNLQRNVLGIAMLVGFSQTASSKRIAHFFVRGKEIAAKHNEVMGSVLREDDLPVPMTSDTYVTESNVSTFSDKLMMYIVTGLISLGISYYGDSMSTALRRDLMVRYDRFIHETLKYSEDGANIFIENGWMEEPPRAVDRNELAKT